MSLTLITGAPGWLGTRLVRVLVEGLPDVPSLAQPDRTRRIRCLVLPGMDESVIRSISDRVEIVCGDLRDPVAMAAFCRDAGGATLFHNAGIVHPARRVREFFEVNARGTEHLLQAAEKAGVRRAVIVSSNSPAGVNSRRDHQFDEDSPYRPYMGYGRSKMLMEQMAREYGARGPLETVIVRLTWFYGPDQPLRQTTFFRMIRNGTVPIVGDGNNMRSMTYIDNACQALLLCEREPAAKGQTFWVADRRPYTMNEIVDTVERLMETEFRFPVAHKRLKVPSVAGEIARLADWLVQSAGLYHQKVHVLSEMNKTIACSIAKAQGELGYIPQIELEEGMRRSLAWCLAQGIAL